MNNKMRTIGSTLIAIMLLIYVGYQVYIVQKKDIQTEEARYGKMADIISADATIIRNETIMTYAYDGVLNYNISNGGKVSAEGVIAEVYQGEEDAAAQRRIAEIDDELERIELLSRSGNQYLANPEMLTRQIGDAVLGIKKSVNSGDYSSLAVYRNEFLAASSKKKVLIGEETDGEFQTKIGQLETEKAALQSEINGSVDEIQAETAGYFLSDMDGFELLQLPEDLSSVDVAFVEQLEAQPAEAEPSGFIGKICSDFDWYVVCRIKSEDVVMLRDKFMVDVEIPDAANSRIPMKVVTLKDDKAKGEAALVLQCTYMNSNLAQLRKENIVIYVNEYEGVLVKEESIHFADVTEEIIEEGKAPRTVVHKDVKGVYVKKGSRMAFVQLFTKKSINGYSICSIELSEEEQAMLVTDTTIQLYDEIIIEGTDLYDGKLL